jgi:hypothetical protein
MEHYGYESSGPQANQKKVCAEVLTNLFLNSQFDRSSTFQAKHKINLDFS